MAKSAGKKLVSLRVPLLIALTTSLVLQGCGTTKHHTALPAHLESQAHMPGFPEVRAWGDVYSKSLEASATQSIQQEKAAHHGKVLPVLYALALSGGGSDGAFGAGFMCGWTKAGTRPQFKLVTGISTGALMAPYIFLGPDYDAKLKTMYTTMSDANIYKPYSMFSVFLGVLNIEYLPSMTSNEPLVKLIERGIDMKVLRRVAAEHRKGRRLLIGSTQFNAQRLVIWNMGEIATIGTPDALKLFRQVMVASSSLPVTFPPHYFTVRAEGKLYEEMHVDGGIEAQVMLYENALLPFAAAIANSKEHRVYRERKLYIIRNEKIYPEWADVKPELKAIAVRSIDSLIKSQGVGDLYRLYAYAERDGIEYNLTYIPKEFTLKPKTPFDNAYMRQLFALGYKMGKSDQKWEHHPPEYTPA